jgi:hypothetical protein
MASVEKVLLHSKKPPKGSKIDQLRQASELLSESFPASTLGLGWQSVPYFTVLMKVGTSTCNACTQTPRLRFICEV